MAQIDEISIQKIIAFEPLEDIRWNALRDFTHSLVEEKGWLNEEKVRSFFNAGFTRTQVFEVIMGVALKTMTNYSNHLAGADPNAEFTSMAEGQTAA